MRRLPQLETARLIVRAFVSEDMRAMHRMAHLCFGDGSQLDDAAALEASRRMHEWRVLNEEMLARLDQPPYGDRAVVLKTNGELIGSVGLVPYIDAFNVMPGLRYLRDDDGSRPRAIAEVGMFWAIDPAHQGHGYATEAARALLDYAFEHMHLDHIIATTDFSNQASQSVMRKLGMRIERNEGGQPPWLQVVGIRNRIP